MIPTTGLEGRLLMAKNPADYKTQRVRVRRDAQAVYIEPEGDIINFKTMMGFRTPAKVEDIQQGIDSKEGYLFANMGISAAVQIRHNGEDYAVAVAQAREDIGDHVFKLISGYTPIETLTTPRDAMLTEIAEEFLPITWDGKFVSGISEGKPMPKPYAQVNAYEDAHPFEVTSTAHESYERLSLDKRTLLMNGKEMPGNPRIYYQAPVNGAQLVFPVTINVDFDTIAGIAHAETAPVSKRAAHLRHAEDKFANGLLNAYLDPEPLCLLKLQDGRLTEELYRFLAGGLCRVDQGVYGIGVDADSKKLVISEEYPGFDPKNVLLSEAFMPSSVHGGIIPQPNVSLKDYLAQK